MICSPFTAVIAVALRGMGTRLRVLILTAINRLLKADSCSNLGTKTSAFSVQVWLSIEDTSKRELDL